MGEIAGEKKNGEKIRAVFLSVPSEASHQIGPFSAPVVLQKLG